MLCVVIVSEKDREEARETVQSIALWWMATRV